jgi:hypothetical protein
MPETVNVMEFASLFPFDAKPKDIEAERQRLESIYDRKLAGFEADRRTRSGVHVTVVTWQEVA